MAKRWAEVAASPEFKALPPPEQEAARGQYFDQVVAPQIPPEEQNAARTQFDQYSKPAIEAQKLASAAKTAQTDTSGGLQDLPIIGPAAYGLATGVPGGKAVAALARTGISKLTEALGGDKGKGYAENRSDIEREATHAFNRGPVSAAISGAATLGEAALTGGALVKGAAALPVVGERIAAAAAPELAAGDTVGNALKLAGSGAATAGTYGAAAGATEGAAQAVGEGNPAAAPVEAVKGAVREGIPAAVGGAVLGPVAGAVTDLATPVIKSAARAVAEKLAPVAAPAVRSVGRVASAVAGQSSNLDNAAKLIAQRVKASPAEVKAAVQDFQDKTGGQMPSVAQILDLVSQRNVADVGNIKNAAGDVFNTAKSQAENALPGQVTKQIARGGAVPTTQQVARAAAADNEAAIAPVRDKLVSLPDKIAPRLQRLVANEVTANNDPEALSALEDNKASVDTLDRVYQKLGDLHNKEPGHGYDALRTGLKNLVTAQVPEYAGVRSTFERGAKVKAGFQAGLQNETAADAASVQEGKSLSDATSQLAQAGGARRRLTDQAAQSNRGALATARTLAEPAGAKAATPQLSDAEQSRLQQGADRLVKGQQALANIAPASQRSDIAQHTDEITGLAKTALLAGSHSTTLFKANMLTNLVTKLRLSNDTAKKFAEALTDPDKVPYVVDLLGKARVNAQEVRDIVAKSAQAAGVQAGVSGAALASHTRKQRR